MRVYFDGKNFLEVGAQELTRIDLLTSWRKVKGDLTG